MIENMPELPKLDEELDCVGLFDSHAHYFDKRYDGETVGAGDILENEVFGRGIEGVINVGTNNKSSRQCVAQAKKYDKMYAAVGIHPEDAMHCKYSLDVELAKLYNVVFNIETLKEQKIVAIGEIGLDYYHEPHDKELQKKYFEYQLCLAEKLDLPVIIHDREAHGDCLEIVMRHPNVRGVFHSYSGSVEMAKELIKRDWYISFSGVLTFKNARKTVEVADAIPLQRILIETDCPYLAPHPYRGRINHSGLLRYTAERLAEIKGEDISHVARITTENTKNLFGI